MNQELEDCQSGNCGCEPSVFGVDVSRRGFMVAAGAFAAGLSAGPLMAADGKDSYAALLKSDPSLRGYWRLDGNLVDAMGKANATASGATTFVGGAVRGKESQGQGTQGQAIRLVPDEPISVASTNHLRGQAASLELFFKVISKPSGDEHPVIIAQSAGQQARYIVGIKNDLSALLYRNVKAEVVTEINLPTNQPIEVGRWYHLVITSFDLDVRAYVDGYECSLFGGAYEFTRSGPKKTTLTLGATSVNGWGSTDLCVDEVACFAKGLTGAEIHEHLKAPGSNTAKVHYKADGWMAHHNTDLWRGTAPVDGAQWGMWPMGGAWLCQHLWEHYLYSGDADHLEKS